MVSVVASLILAVEEPEITVVGNLLLAQITILVTTEFVTLMRMESVTEEVPADLVTEVLL